MVMGMYNLYLLHILTLRLQYIHTDLLSSSFHKYLKLQLSHNAADTAVVIMRYTALGNWVKCV